jgi:hypothetical protein
MSERRHFWDGILSRKAVAPIILSTGLSVSIFLDQFLAVAGVLAGAGLILLIIRWANQRHEPLREIGEIVLRNDQQDSAWMEELRKKHRDANQTTIQSWQQYAVAIWIFLAALFINLGYLAVVTLFRFLEQYFGASAS